MSATPVRIACFGDSLTEGYGLAPDEALPVVLERMLYEEGIHATCLNFGVSGDTAGDGVDRINEVLNAEPDAAIVEFGANDCFMSEPVEVVTANLSAIIEALRGQSIPILLVGITALTNLDDAYKARFDPLYERLADKYDLPLFPDILSCYFRDSSMKLLDKMHPNAQGVEAIAGKLLPYAKDLVESV